MTDLDLTELKNAAEKFGKLYVSSTTTKDLLDYVAIASCTNILSLISRLERAETALKYYAADYERPNEGPWGMNSTDWGETARKALEASK